MNIEDLKKLKGVRKITMLAAYDYPTAKILDAAGLDLILIGDSLGRFVLGHSASVKGVTIGDMIRHTEAVARGTESAVVVSDMPIDTYSTVSDAISNAQKLLDAGADAVKLEGYKPGVVEGLLSSGIQVMGHLGVKYQTDATFGVRERQEEIERIYGHSLGLDRLGAFSIVLSLVGGDGAKMITENVSALTIGIGSGIHCDGQVLVVNRFLGMEKGEVPAYSKKYCSLYETIFDAVKEYIEDVRDERFPGKAQSFS